MNTNTFSGTASSQTEAPETPGIIATLVAAVILALRHLLKRVAAPRPEPLSKEEFSTALLAIKDRTHGDHLALLEKLDANHRELLAALDRQASRVNALEAGLARVDERTRK
jgi:hypothetical protein